VNTATLRQAPYRCRVVAGMAVSQTVGYGVLLHSFSVVRTAVVGSRRRLFWLLAAA
jgi:hypothetical protein